MGKQGPCCHCGVTSTPLWRNGPPEKPVLCNACGSRWRTKGSLVNYTPLHSRSEADDYDGRGGCSRGRRGVPVVANKEVRPPKRKRQSHDGVATTSALRVSLVDAGLHKPLDEDTGNRSSSGSAISISESCTPFVGGGGYTDASDLTGSSQPAGWDGTIPSRKRTCVGRPRESSVEKLAKDLCSILHEQSSYLSGSSEEDLLPESLTPMLSVETGHGSVLIRRPAGAPGREEESEASSLSFATPPLRLGAGTPPDRDDHSDNKREKERFRVLGSRDSPLCCVDIQEVVNFREFEQQLTGEEQLQLLKYLPCVDFESVRDVFGTSRFREDLLGFQKLLAFGILEHSDDCRELRRLALTERTKSKWVECYSLLLKKREDEARALRGRPDAVDFGFSSHPPQAPGRFSGSVVRGKEEKRVGEEGQENEGGWFSPKSLFCVPAGGGELMLDAMGAGGDEGCDQGVLLDVLPGGSFPQAELLPTGRAPSSCL